MGLLEDSHPDHDWYQLFSEPSELGFKGLSRYRTWVIGAHKQQTVCQYDPFELYDEIVSQFQEFEGAEVSHFLVASREEINQEALEMAQSRKISAFIPGVHPLSILLNRKFWLPAQDRWLTSKEKLISMGFPVTAELADSMRVPLVGAKDCKRAADLAGQGMHFQTAGIMQLLALACFAPCAWVCFWKEGVRLLGVFDKAWFMILIIPVS